MGRFLTILLWVAVLLFLISEMRMMRFDASLAIPFIWAVLGMIIFYDMTNY